MANLSLAARPGRASGRATNRPDPLVPARALGAAPPSLPPVPAPAPSPHGRHGAAGVQIGLVAVVDAGLEVAVEAWCARLVAHGHNLIVTFRALHVRPLSRVAVPLVAAVAQVVIAGPALDSLLEAWPSMGSRAPAGGRQ